MEYKKGILNLMSIHNKVMYIDGKFYQIQILIYILQERIENIQHLQFLYICNKKDDMINKLNQYPKNIEINNPDKFKFVMAISK